jgi:hypothetical protein
MTTCLRARFLLSAPQGAFAFQERETRHDGALPLPAARINNGRCTGGPNRSPTLCGGTILHKEVTLAVLPGAVERALARTQR